MEKDDIFDYPQAVLDFSFDERTTAVFADMVHRSIPAYAALLQMNAAIGDYFLRQGEAQGKIYDLGCSLGGVSLALRRVIPADWQIVAVDNSAAMTKRFSQYIEGAGIQNIKVETADICAYPIADAKLVVLNFVLQFIAPEERLKVLEKIYRALHSGGVLLLAEKTSYSDDFSCFFHENFKRHQGYSELAIAQKRESLEQVMRVDSVQKIEERLKNIGFSQVIPYFQAFSFRAWAAIK